MQKKQCNNSACRSSIIQHVWTDDETKPLLKRKAMENRQT